jgi:hypothetical protein
MGIRFCQMLTAAAMACLALGACARLTQTGPTATLELPAGDYDLTVAVSDSASCSGTWVTNRVARVSLTREGGVWVARVAGASTLELRFAATYRSGAEFSIDGIVLGTLVTEAGLGGTIVKGVSFSARAGLQGSSLVGSVAPPSTTVAGSIDGDITFTDAAREPLHCSTASWELRRR